MRTRVDTPISRVLADHSKSPVDLLRTDLCIREAFKLPSSLSVSSSGTLSADVNCNGLNDISRSAVALTTPYTHTMFSPSRKPVAHRCF
jgi:hypothetical protein